MKPKKPKKILSDFRERVEHAARLLGTAATYNPAHMEIGLDAYTYHVFCTSRALYAVLSDRCAETEGLPSHMRFIDVPAISYGKNSSVAYLDAGDTDQAVRIPFSASAYDIAVAMKRHHEAMRALYGDRTDRQIARARAEQHAKGEAFAYLETIGLRKRTETEWESPDGTVFLTLNVSAETFALRTKPLSLEKLHEMCPLMGALITGIEEIDG